MGGRALGFQLTIAKGLQAGKELLFEQAQIEIGRTTENDVVLQDAGVSRKHVRISDRLGRFYVQDLGSANGTLVNDAPLSGERELQNGDRIALGPVEFVFKEVVSEDDATRPFMPVADEDEDATRLIRRNQPLPAEPRTQLEPGKAAPQPASFLPTPRLEQVPSVPPVLAPVPGPLAVARSETLAEALAVEPPTTAPLSRAAPARAAAPTAPARPSPASGADGLSAADKARRRRELNETLGGQLALWWLGLSRGGKLVLSTVVLLLLAGMVGGLAVVFRPSLEGLSRGPEPTSLGLQVVTDSFGLGEGVTWEQPDMKLFDFEFVSPTRAVAVLRYQASGISKDEVSLTLNATVLGSVPPDMATASEREIQQIISPSLLKRNEDNQLVFDNVHNPPGRDSWRVWNLRLEIIPVPDLRPEELLETARSYVARARDFYERKDVGAENLSLAWENYRSAWITLEALDEKPELYEDVRHMMGQVAVDLDQKCGQLMLEFQKHVQFKDKKRARRVIDEITRRFPTPAHRCHNLALEKANEHGL
ncbi:type III secretion system (T3SS) inner membrane Yop/YscD-like protein [Archangium gephyra]|uniref:Adenylate cyclase n=1 Tax=Archangium gephyra TaxID=48 RepID=A0AAC8TE78_9BACT|nr:FHA domain-containing protein [Archangium gephyra]AKJ02687.1 Adenylate cyclase [Archangium gephyra]REG23232.1 type III secretion system (T3SS) inner membrane Yop/YscD-like protein [Archangium gephyra]